MENIKEIQNRKQLVAANVEKAFYNQTEEDIEKAINRAGLELRQTTVNGKLAHRWFKIGTDIEHAPHGTKVMFDHGEVRKIGTVGRVSSSKRYVIKDTEGNEHKKHPHEIEIVNEEPPKVEPVKEETKKPATINEIGAKVTHGKFGTGEVKAFDEGTIRIDFGGDIGEKVLLKKYAVLNLADDQNTTITAKPEPKPAITAPNKVEENKAIPNISIGDYFSLKHGDTYTSVKVNKIENGKVGFYGDKMKGELLLQDFANNIKPITAKKEKVAKFGNDNIKVLVTSAKGALLVTDGEKVAWIMNKMMKENGDLTPKGIEALKESKDTYDNYKEAQRIREEGFTINNSSTEKQTEKARLIKFDYEGEPVQTWIPESKIKVDKVSGNLIVDGKFWLDAKKEEIELSIRNQKPVEVSGSVKEYDNSYGLAVSVYENLSEQSVNRVLFFPKKLVTKTESGNLNIPRWLLNKKIDQVKEDLETNNFSARVMEVEGFYVNGEETYDSWWNKINR